MGFGLVSLLTARLVARSHRAAPVAAGVTLGAVGCSTAMTLGWVLPGGPFAGVVVLVAASLFGVRCAFAMARGEGTPVPFDAAARLVVTGPYRWVRNPMALSGVTQALGVALLGGSPSYYLVPPAGALLWQFLVRPSEERFLAGRFGAEFTAYRRAVPLWVPRRPGPGPGA